jgi:hypothetical protein
LQLLRRISLVYIKALKKTFDKIPTAHQNNFFLFAFHQIKKERIILRKKKKKEEKEIF